MPETWAELPGWAEDDHLSALQAFRAGCSVARDLELTIICQSARSAQITDAADYSCVITNPAGSVISSAAADSASSISPVSLV